MAWVPAAIAAGSAIYGGMQAGNDRDAANANSKRAMEIIGAVQVPELKEWLLQQYSSAGTFTPEMMNALNLDPSAQGAISLNPAERQKQVDLIDRMIGQSKSGMTPEDQAAYTLATRTAAGQNQAQQGAILQNMQARGMGGSGVELASRLSASQNSSDMLQQAALEKAAQQNALKLQALQASTGALSNLRGQDYSQQLNLANANDARSQANWANAQSIANGNTGNMNEAQKFNLANRQRTQDNNTDLYNKQYQYNNGGLQQQNYANQMQKAQGMAGQYTQQANQQYQQAGQTAGMYAGVGQGIGTIYASATAPKYDANGNVIK